MRQNFSDCKKPSIEAHLTPSMTNSCAAKLLNEQDGYAFCEPMSILTSAVFSDNIKLTFSGFNHIAIY